MFKKVSFDFVNQELNTLNFWKEKDVFNKSLLKNKSNKSFVFYEGPPTANGKPHNGHVLTRTMKDVFLRFKSMNGFNVERKAGWDTHGLPVEIEVQKNLNLQNKDDIFKYGVKPFVNQCISSVFNYTNEWEKLTESIGFWVDLDDAYVTYHKDYIESVWWALSQMHKNKLLYRGHKVVWWWAQGGTSLSAAEVSQGYKDIETMSAFVKFKSKDFNLLVWTTTPWTLPSNMFIAVNPNETYGCYEVDGEKIVVAESLAESVFAKTQSSFKLTQTFRGSELVDLKYEPPFAKDFTYKVVAGDFVSTSDGTGLVHIAPFFGEEDYKLYLKLNVKELFCHVNSNGCFDDFIPELHGKLFKDCNKPILQILKNNNYLFHKEIVKHSYPFCWRSENDELIQMARPAWYVKTTEKNKELITNNQNVNWYPNNIKEGRFGDFLKNNIDWSISRERFWGTPLNIWVNDVTGNVECPSSMEEIISKNPNAFDSFYEERKTNPNLSEHLVLHKPWIDDVVWNNPNEPGTYRRVPEVIDCWFDSGCVPFAQFGFPHKNIELFKSQFPSDFISEAIDQTRGWFYSMLAVCTLVFDEDVRKKYNLETSLPYKNSVVLGHVCDSNGKKESKSKGNYTSPDLVLNSVGADAFRWFFYASNPSHSNTKHSLENVKNSQKDTLIKLYNVYNFFVTYANLDGWNFQKTNNKNKSDIWILENLKKTVSVVTNSLNNFDTYTASSSIQSFVENLSNWYVRLNRSRFWEDGMSESKLSAYQTLHKCLLDLSVLLAPFTPFLAEDIFQNLKESDVESVHLMDWLKVESYSQNLLEDMDAVIELISAGRAARINAGIKTKQPLKEVTIVTSKNLNDYHQLIQEELNTLHVHFKNESNLTNKTFKVNFKNMGKRGLGKKAQELKLYLDTLTSDDMNKLSFPLVVNEFTYTEDDVFIHFTALPGYSAYNSKNGLIIINTEENEELIFEGVFRELKSIIQKERKSLNMDVNKRAKLNIFVDDKYKSFFMLNKDRLFQEIFIEELNLVDSGKEVIINNLIFKLEIL